MLNIRGVSAKKEIPIVISVLVLLVLAGWYLWHQHQNSIAAKKAAYAVPTGWTEYKNQKYNFRLIYPRSWRAPQVLETGAKHGKTYNIQLGITNAAGQKYQDAFSIALESSDYSRQVCNPRDLKDCTNSKALTSEDINNALTSSQNGFLKSDSTSYTLYRSSGGIFSGLETYQIVDLPKMNATAAQATYYRWGDQKNCPKNSLASEIQTNCLDQSTYDTINKVLKSLKTISTST